MEKHLLFGPALYWPILDFGTLDALLHAQKFRAEEKFINYRSVVLASIEEANVRPHELQGADGSVADDRKGQGNATHARSSQRAL